VKLLLVAVGQRQPAWADSAYDDFAKRFPPELRLALKAVKAEPRGGKSAGAADGRRGRPHRRGDSQGARRVVLDEHGTRVTTLQLAQRMKAWMADGRDVALLVGGPDGLDAALKATADETLRLSDLTLPHAFVRVLVAEALYRAWTVMVNHPYHRE
jgi:23S rRNA (pseudouridine1915-N3)-methyltransferase